jgi:hypothetical protein
LTKATIYYIICKSKKGNIKMQIEKIVKNNIEIAHIVAKEIVINDL